MKPTKTLSKKAVHELSRLLDGCNRCEHDEAEGGIQDHCHECRGKVTRWAYENWCSLALTQALFGNPRTALQQRGIVQRRVKRMASLNRTTTARRGDGAAVHARIGHAFGLVRTDGSLSESHFATEDGSRFVGLYLDRKDAEADAGTCGVIEFEIRARGQS